MREPSGIHMPLHIVRGADSPAGRVFAVAHRHQSRGCEVADPEVTLVCTAVRAWIPVSIRTPFAHTVTVDASGARMRVVRPDEHHRLVALVDVWMQNIAMHLLGEGVPEMEIARSRAYAAE